MSAKDIRNIVLLGHGGSGKTTLAESMLFMTGGTDRFGKVTDGNTTCDYDAEEIKRNISFSLAVAPVKYKNVKINVLDTPGNFDFAYDNYSFKYADPLSQLDRLTTGGAVNDGRYSLPQFDALVKEASEKLVASERYELFAQAEGMLINGGYIIPWESGGGTYGMTREIPFTAPRGGFGLSRFKYKGMQLSEEPISAEQYKQLEDEFYEQLLKRNAG